MTAVLKRGLKGALSLFVGNETKQVLRAFRALPDGPALGLVDVGAAGDLEPRWKPVESELRYFGFEPDSRSADALVDADGDSRTRTIFPCALWDTDGPLSINLCRDPQKSSHFPPNRPFVDAFASKDRFDIADTAAIDAKTMDSLSIERPDFIKLDVQGGELAVLKGADATLKHTLGLEIEVEFHPIYENQPLFGAIQAHLAARGFAFVDFVNLYRWERTSFNGLGQCIFADALFLRTPEAVVGDGPDRSVLSAYLKILLLYRRFDLIDTTLSLTTAEQRTACRGFVAALTPLRRGQRRMRALNRLTGRLLHLSDGPYGSHLLY